MLYPETTELVARAFYPDEGCALEIGGSLMGTVVNRVQPFVISRNVNNEGNFTDYPLAGYVHEPDLSAVAGELTRQGAVLWRSFRSQGLERT